MKLVHTSRGDKYFITGNKKFSMFFLGGADLLTDSKLQEEELFSLSSRNSYIADDIFNSGERQIHIEPLSLEEKHELFTLFQENGFKIRVSDIENVFEYPSRAFFTENDYMNYVEEGSASFNRTYGYGLRLILTRKQFPKFQEFLRTLSNVYNYKTEYIVGKPNTQIISSSSRRYYNTGRYIVK